MKKWLFSFFHRAFFDFSLFFGIIFLVQGQGHDNLRAEMLAACEGDRAMMLLNDMLDNGKT